MTRKIRSYFVIIGILLGTIPGFCFAEEASESCRIYEWYKINSNGETYTINVLTSNSMPDLNQRPLSEIDPIEGIYVVDSNGDILADTYLAEKLIIDAQSSARFVEIDPWEFDSPIIYSDIYSDTRRDYVGNDYLIIGPAYTADWWRDNFLYSGVMVPPPLLPLPGLDTYWNREDVWEQVILDAILQPGICDNPETDGKLLHDLNSLLGQTSDTITFSNIVIQNDKFRKEALKLPLFKDIPVSGTTLKHLDKFSDQFSAASGFITTTVEIHEDAMNMFYLHTLANARAEERLNALGTYIHANEDELDPALVKGYERAESKFGIICDEYYSYIGDVLRSGFDGDTAVDYAFATSYLISAFEGSTYSNVILPYYISWRTYNGLKDKNNKVQRLTMAATLQKHLSGQTRAHGLESFQDVLEYNDPKDDKMIEESIALYNINYYLGWYFYSNYYEVSDGTLEGIFGKLNEWFTGAPYTDVLNYLNSQSENNKDKWEDVKPPYLLTEFDYLGWRDYAWLTSKLRYNQFEITASTDKMYYRPGESTKVVVNVKNIGGEKDVWLGVSFKDPFGEFSKYDSQISITPQQVNIAPCEVKLFDVEWVIPEDAPSGMYQIAINCHKDDTFTEKYADNLDWAPIFTNFHFEIISPTASNPAIVGKPTDPSEFNAKVSVGPDRSFLLPDDFEIKIGDISAEFEIYNIDSEGSYYFKIAPPIQPAQGLYNLSISVDNASISEYDTAPNAVTYFEFIPIDLCIVLDKSGSMSDSMGYGTKMDSAKEAAKGAVDGLLSFGGTHDRVSIVSFSDTATTNIGFTEDFSAAKARINQLGAGGGTSFGAGLRAALREIDAHGDPNRAPAILFMSDGHHGDTPNPDSYVSECKNRGIPIFTVGFASTESGVDAARLKWMADETGGKYMFAGSSSELQNIFLELQHKASGWEIVDSATGTVSPGETVAAATFYVEPGTEFRRITLKWPGSDLDIILKYNGTIVDPSEYEIIYSGDTNPEFIIVKDPKPGNWTVEVYGKELDGPEEFQVLISDYVPPEPLLPPLGKNITIKETSGDVLVDYQVVIPLNPSNFPDGAKEDGSDLRFIDKDRNRLNYWVQSWSNDTKTATVWVKVPNIAANGETHIEMRYGNPGASSQSNGYDTFEFFDDFEDDSIDANKWVADSASPDVIAETSGKLLIRANAMNDTVADVVSKVSYGPSVAMKFGANVSEGHWLDHKGLGFLRDNVGDDFNEMEDYVYWRGQEDRLYTSNRYNSTSSDISYSGCTLVEHDYASGYRTWEIRWLDSEIRYYINDILKAAHVAAPPKANIPPGFSLKTYTNVPTDPAEISVDWVLVRKCAPSEPAILIEG